MKPKNTALPADCREVMDAASALRIREYDLFRLAHKRWFGREGDEKALERTFVAYMFHHAVPPWVRHLSRETLLRAGQGTLDSGSLGAGDYRQIVPAPRLGKLYVALTMAAMMVLYAMLLDTTYDPQTSAPVRGCPGATGTKFFEDWIHVVLGKVPPPCDAYRIRGEGRAGTAGAGATGPVPGESR